MSLSAKDEFGNPAMGNFSVSVIDENILPLNRNEESSILSNLLLTSEVKGYIEEPNYYFEHADQDTRSNLDILLMTQGFRRFTWKQLLYDKMPPVKFIPEKYLNISGTIRSSSGKPVKNESVFVTEPAGNGPQLTQVTDSAGRFTFKNLLFSDTAHLVFTAKKYTSRIILINNNPGLSVMDEGVPGYTDDVNNIMTAYLKNKLQRSSYESPKSGTLLKTVNIRSKRRNDLYRTQSLAGSGNADQMIHGNDIHGGGLLSDQLNGRLRGITFVRGVPFLTLTLMSSVGEQNGPSPMLVVVDGTEMSADGGGGVGYNINNINFYDVETVEVLKSANASIYGMNGGAGVLVITTKQIRDVDTDDPLLANVLHASIMGFYKAKEFYSPKYEVTVVANKQPDLRATIYWKPEVLTDNDGNNSFTYYNADGVGTYRVLIEGIDNKGKIGRLVYRYRVE
jgi:TonB-dependent SusC/RagA subfamily outer membrane receptor